MIVSYVFQSSLADMACLLRAVILTEGFSSIRVKAERLEPSGPER
ncbi:hypothetical protein [Granulicella tundricola]|nr:hypothetical protein [Granulicella tundricola]